MRRTAEGQDVHSYWPTYKLGELTHSDSDIAQTHTCHSSVYMDFANGLESAKKCKQSIASMTFPRRQRIQIRTAYSVSSSRLHPCARDLAFAASSGKMLRYVSLNVNHGVFE